jgi:hypothetical protein
MMWSKKDKAVAPIDRPYWFDEVAIRAMESYIKAGGRNQREIAEDSFAMAVVMQSERNKYTEVRP